MFHHLQVGMPQPVGRLHQAETRLLVQRWIVAEPDHHRAWVAVELEFLIFAVEQRLEYLRGHYRFAGTGGGSQREGMLVAILAPALARLFQIRQHITDGFVLVVLEGEFHASSPLAKPKLVR